MCPFSFANMKPHSSVVVDRKINPSQWTLSDITRSSQCSMTGVTGVTGVTKYGMCYPVCRMVHIKDPLLLFRKSSIFTLLVIYPTPYNHKYKCVKCVIK